MSKFIAVFTVPRCHSRSQHLKPEYQNVLQEARVSCFFKKLGFWGLDGHQLKLIFFHFPPKKWLFLLSRREETTRSNNLPGPPALPIGQLFCGREMSWLLGPELCFPCSAFWVLTACPLAAPQPHLLGLPRGAGLGCGWTRKWGQAPDRSYTPGGHKSQEMYQYLSCVPFQK